MINRRRFLKGIVGLAALLALPKAGVAQLVEPRVAGSSPAASPKPVIHEGNLQPSGVLTPQYSFVDGVLTVHDYGTARDAEFVGIKKIIMGTCATLAGCKLIFDHRAPVVFVPGRHSMVIKNIMSHYPQYVPTNALSGTLFVCCDNYVQCAAHAAMTRS